MKKVTVFGGSGFLGSYVCDELTKRGYETVIADLKDSQYQSESQTYMACDIMDPSRVDEAVKGADVVYNFAGVANIDKSIHRPRETMEQNIIGNLNILEACKKLSIERYVYASSAYAFSDKGGFYGISKLASEKVIEEYYARFGIPYTIIRYGSLYGERADAHNGMCGILRQALAHGEIIQRGDGEAVREFIHAKDAAKLSANIIESDTYISEHIVLTGVERLKHKELFRMIQDILNHPVDIKTSDEVWEGHYQVTPYSFHPNVAKKLVPNPFIDLGQEIAECIRHIHEELENEKVNLI
jgi:UDP-glucose 4-epimerase